MGRLTSEESDRRIGEIAQWICAGLPKREIIGKIREVFKLRKAAPKWFKLAMAALARDMPDLADLRVEATSKARELYRCAYAGGNLSEANKALALLARLTGIEEAPAGGQAEIVVRFARAEEEAPAKPGEA